MADASPITPGCGIVRRIGWEKDEETGAEVFRAIIDFPNGPPNLLFSTIWDRKPVNVTEATL